MKANDVANYLNQLNLHSPPFVANSDERFFYADPERSKYLDMLQHLLQYSDETLLLTGETGSGKSTLLDKFAARTDEQWLLCHIECGDATTADTLFNQIAACFQLQTGSDAGSMLEGLSAQLEELHQDHFPILLIDDAQNLSEDALEMIMHLAALDGSKGKLLHLVLAGGNELVERLGGKRFANLSPPHRLELEGMGEAHSAAYLMCRLQAAGHDGDSPFTVAELKQLHVETNGIPGKLNLAANQLLNRKYGKRFSSNNLRRMLQAGVAAIALIGTVLGVHDRIGVLFGNDEQMVMTAAVQQPDTKTAEKPVQPVKQPVITEPTAPNVSQAAKVLQPVEPQLVVKKEVAQAEQSLLVVKNEAPEIEPIKVAANSGFAQNGTSAVVPEELKLSGTEPEMISITSESLRLLLRGTGFRPGTKVALSRDGKVEVLQQDLVEFIDPTRLAISVTPGVKESDWALQISTPDNRRSNVLRVQVVSSSVEEKGQISQPVTTDTAVSNAAVIETKPQPVQELPPVKAAPVARPAAKPSVVTEKKDTKGDSVRGSEWYGTQPKENYTLQLMASASRTNINAFINQHKLPGPLASFSMKKDGRMLHVLTHGIFASKQAAEKAAGNLPKEVKSWARSISSIQQVMLVDAAPAKTVAPTDAGPDAAWIWSQDPARYTIQLAAGRNEAAVLQVKTQVTLPGELAVAKALRDGKPWFVLVYGSFPNKESAHDTISRLPAGLRESGPWVRSFSSLQDELSRSTPSR